MRIPFVLSFCITLTLAWPAGAGEYCVQNVPVHISGQEDVAPSQDSHVVAPTDQQLYSGHLQKLQDADSSVFFDNRYVVRGADGAGVRHTVFWSFLPDYTITGTGSVDNGYVLMSTTVGSRSMAVDGAGNIYWIGERRVHDGSGNINFGGNKGEGLDVRIFVRDPDNPQGDSGQKFLSYGAPNGIFYSRIADSIVMSIRPAQNQRSHTYAFKAGQMQILDENDTEVAADIPSLKVTALLGWDALRFMASDGTVSPVAYLNSGDDYHGWDRLSDLGDGWICAEGAQYANAVHVEQVSGQWRVIEIVRLRPKTGLFEGFISWLLDMDNKQMGRDRLSRIMEGASCSNFSRLQQPSPIPEAARDLGYAESYGLTVFRDGAGRIYLKAGNDVRIAKGAAPGGSAILHDIPSVKRLFITTHEGEYELVRDGDTFAMVAVNLPPHEMPLFTRFVATPDGQGLFAVTREAIYQFREGRFQPFWLPASGRKIATTGSVDPVPIPEWNGILFGTFSLDDVAGPEALMLVKQCAAASR